MPKVAIITRTKDRPLLLARCIQSVLNQTCQDWLHVIVNDGGDPAAVDSLVSQSASSYGQRVQVIHNPDSVGMQNAGNLGIRASASEYVTIHDDDDSWLPTFLEECVRYLEARGPDAVEQGVAVQSAWITEEIDSWGNVVELSRRDYYPFEAVSFFQAGGRNPYPPIAFLYRRRVHEVIGWFDQAFNELGDWDFNLRFLSHYDIGTIAKRLACYHWRHQAHGSGYGNSATDGLASHRQNLVRMQNHYLRRDLAQQRLGLGIVLNVAAGFDSQAGWLHGLHEKAGGQAWWDLQLMAKAEHLERITADLTRIWKLKFLMRRACDQMADWRSRTATAMRPAAATGPAPDMADRLASARVLSLDVFDTALLRLVRKPTDVFLYMQEDVRRLLARPALRFVDVRVRAEEQSREEMRRAGLTDETTLDRIYEVLRRTLGCDAATAQRIQQWEIEAEYYLSYPNPEIERVARRAAETGKQVVFASDMYLPSATVTGLLERHGFAKPTLFLSSEAAASKSEGRMFEQIVARLKCQPAEVLHIGDNKHSDFDRAQDKGLNAHHWTRAAAQVPLVDQHLSLTGAWEGDLASSLYTGLVRRRRLTHPVDRAGDRAYWQMIGYEVIGPLYLSFVSWVIARAKAQRLKKIFFLSRDGYHLVKVFNRLRERYELAMEADYLFASRRLWNVPSIYQLDEDSLRFLVTPNPGMRVRHFLERIGLNPAAHVAVVRQSGFSGLDQPVTTKDGVFSSDAYHQNMRQLMRQFEGLVLEESRRERQALLQYFEDMGLLNAGAGIVDLGWQASSLKSLHVLLRLAKRERQIPGFYFGTWHFAQGVVDAGHSFESFFMHLDKPLARSWIVGESVELLETFFWAPHPTIVGIEKTNGLWEPRYGEPEIDAGQQAWLQVATDVAFEFIQDALALRPNFTELAPPYGYLETTLERVLRYPRKDEAAVLGDLALRSNFGGRGPLRHLARLPSPWNCIRRAEGIQDAFDHCYWKKGFLAQLSPRMKKYVRT